MNDPVIELVRAARERLAQEAGFDIHQIAQNARKRDENQVLICSRFRDVCL